MTKKIFLVLFLLSIFTLSFGESEIDKFYELLNAEKYEDVESFLGQWEAQSPTDPELYVAYFNYYISRATQEQMYVESFLPENYKGQYLQGQNENGDKLYIFSIIEYDEELSAKAFEYIDRGLALNPTRLDMYFGKAQFNFMLEKYTAQLEVLKKTFELNEKYKNKWLWGRNVSINDVGVSFEMSIHDYISKWLTSGNLEALNCSKELALLFIEKFPNNSVAYNDAAVAFIYLGDLVSAKKYLEAGYKVDKSDMLVLANLAYVCKNLGEIEKSRNYYKILEQSSDPTYSNMAKQRLADFE